MRRHAWIGVVVVGLALWLLAVPTVRAVITRELPLRTLIDDSPFIFTARVSALDAEKQRLLLIVDEHLKGKLPFAKMPVLLKGDREAARGKQTPQLLKRLANELPVVLFVVKREDEYLAFAYTNGTWFHVTGVKPDGADSVRWSFTHLEPYMRRTFKGSTSEMKQTLKDVLQGKRKPPESDPKEKPGLGPEVTPEKKQGLAPPLHQGPVFAVIPSVMVGGPLAVLAMLFPTLFGGWKRWLAFISVVCTTSTIYLLHWWLGTSLHGTLWERPLVLWLALTTVTFLGCVWAWVRHARLVEAAGNGGTSGQPAVQAPGKVEVTLLVILSLVGLTVLGYGWRNGGNLLELTWLQVLVIGIGAWAGTLYAFTARWRGPRPRSVLSTEVVMLSAMVLASTLLTATQGRARASIQTAAAPAEVKLAWKFIPKKQDRAIRGQMTSMPLVAGDRVYAAIAVEDTYQRHGTVYCLDRKTGETIWASSGPKEEKFKMIALSSPCLADGRLYVGEGYHEDSFCRLHCLDADTGKSLWVAETSSHVESSPVVAVGRVYFGAGDDGVYCVDAETGKPVWHCPGLHVDSTPLVQGGRVYVGSGVGDLVKEKAAVCLDAAKGTPLWKRPLDLPAWGSPVQAGQLIYFGIGEGRLDFTSPYSKGALLALKAEDGEEAWRVPTQSAVLRGPVVDRYRVYFGERNGIVHAVDAATGQHQWKRQVGSGLFTSPVLARSTETGATLGVYVLSADGVVFCLGASTARSTGRSTWSRSSARGLS